jgi:hypothetical protein
MLHALIVQIRHYLVQIAHRNVLIVQVIAIIMVLALIKQHFVKMIPGQEKDVMKFAVAYMITIVKDAIEVIIALNA